MRTFRLFTVIVGCLVVCVLGLTAPQLRVIDPASAAVNPPNAPPVAVDDNYTVHGTLFVPGNSVLVNDSDPDNDAIHFESCGAVAHGTLQCIYQHQAFGYTPDTGYVGTDSFTYQLCDPYAACVTGTVHLNVVNGAPVAGADSFTVHGLLNAGGTTAMPDALRWNDSDPDGDAIGVISYTQASHGTFGYLSQYGVLSYVPNPGYTGADSVTYQLCDNIGLCTTGNVTFNVVNQPPVAEDDLYIARGSQLSVPGPNTLRANDSDPDGDQFSIVSYTQTSHGSVVYSTQPGSTFGNLTYTPTTGYTGTDFFTYQECDDLGLCDSATVTILILGPGENLGACSPCPGGGGAMAVGGPINVTNGNMYLQQVDYTLPGVGPALSIERTFNSGSTQIGLFGRGWSSEYDESITSIDGNLKRLNRPDGRAVYLGHAVGAAGAYSSLVGDFHGSLAQNGRGGLYTLTMADGSLAFFNASGKLVSRGDRIENQTALAYDSSGKLTSATDPFGRVLSFTTNSNGQVLSIADTLGTIATYTYGSSSELLSVTYADNSALTFTYDSNFRLLSAIDALGNVVESHTYDSQGRATTSERQGGVEHYGIGYANNTRTDVTDALGHVIKYTIDKTKGRNVVTKVEGLCSCGGGVASLVQTWTYNAQLELTAMTDALNHTTTFTYDGNGNRLTETNATGTITYTYNSFSQVLTRTNQLGGVTTNTYDSQGNPLTTKDALNNTTSFTHDSHGHLLTVTNARGKVTTYTWDTSGRMTQTKDALNQTTDLAYDDRARVTSVTNPLSETTDYEYDAAGRLKKVILPDSTFVTNTYDLAGRRTKVTDPNGNDTTFAYDSAYRRTSVTDAASQTTSFGYDAMSNQTSQTDALGRVTNFEYDDFYRLKKVIYPPATTGATRLEGTTEYDAGGNVKKKIDTAGRQTTFVYDNVDRLTSSTDADGKTTTFEYDALSRTTQVQDALSQEYEFAYDAVGRRTGMSRGGHAMSFAYDAVGNRTQRTDYNGATTNYTFNDLNRLTTIAYPDSTGTTYTYDALSRMATAVNENGTVSFTYDNRGRIASTTDVFNKTLAFAYDANSNRTAMTLNSSAYAAYTYDVVNRLTQLSDSSAVAATYAYNAVSEPTSRTLVNGVVSSYEYDGLGRMTRLRDIKGTGSILDNQYAYNTARQISEIAELGGTKQYGYDAIDRLTSGPGESYDYDAVGNRTTNGDYTYGDVNQLVTFTSLDYTYDANGNQVTRLMGTGGQSRVYDFENRLTQVDLVGSLGPHPQVLTVAYKYDALGRRIERTHSDGLVQRFVYDGDDVLQDLDDQGNVVASYLNGPGIDNKIRQTDANGNLYFTSDHLGSTRALTNDSGIVVEQLDYDSFGNSAGSSYTRYTYTGREYDADTELYYYRARFYDPQVGRFISEDPIGLAGGINAFAYASNNPTNHVDPTGLADIDVHYYLTYYLAMATGCFNESQAREIAEGDQHSDEDKDKLPGLGLKPHPYGVEFGVIEDKEQQQRNRDFHAFGTRAENEQRLLELRNAAGTTNLFGFGTYLHFLQDMYTHASSAGNITWGQTVSGLGHSTDQTSWDPEGAMASAHASFDALKNFGKRRGACKCVNGPDWGVVQRFIDVGYHPANPIGIVRETSNAQLRAKIEILNVPWRSRTGR
jgi:RHS repeat-associated protein